MVKHSRMSVGKDILMQAKQKNGNKENDREKIQIEYLLTTWLVSMIFPIRC